MKPEIYLIGTNHYDLKGPARLEKLLDHLRPGYVSVEFDLLRAQEAEQKDEMLQSPEQRRELEKEILCYFLNANRETVRRTSQINGYGYLTARDYCQQNGIPTSLPLILTDSAESVLKITQEIETYKDITDILSMSLSELTETVEQSYQDDFVSLENLKRFDDIARDAYTEKKLRQLARKVDLSSKIKDFFGKKQKKPDRIVHVGGLAHSFGNYYNLFDRLVDLNPVRIKLNEADKL